MIYNLTAKINNSDRKFIDKFHSFSVNSSMNENISGELLDRSYEKVF